MDNSELQKNLANILTKFESIKNFKFSVNGNPDDVIKFKEIIKSCQSDNSEWVDFKFGAEILNEDGSITYHDCEIEKASWDG